VREGPGRANAGRAARGPGATFALVTLGCPKNEADSQRLEDLLVAAGHRPAAVTSADLVIVNTCGFIDDAKEESIAAILDVCEATHARGARAAAIGCLVQRYRADLERELPEVDVLAGFDTQPLFDALAAVGGRGRGGAAEAAPRRPRPLHSYIKISDGCDHRCSFCAIPLIKGAYEMMPSDAILEVAGAALSRGARELVLVGQDTSLWSEPGYGALPRLLSDLHDLGPHWLRLMYLQPEHLDDELLEAVAAYAVPYLDVPLQHASRGVLRAMGRRGDGDEFLGLLDRVRSVVPGIAVRSTFIAGFPGETERDVEELESFIAAAGLAVAGVFAFDPQEGTAAATLGGQIDTEVRLARAARLSSAIEDAARQYWEAFRARDVEMLVEHGSLNGVTEVIGRIAWQAPDVDGVTVASPRRSRRGQLARVTIGDVAGYDLMAD
jgi:ribosomal protein S12 methylthiotransferase